MAILWQDAAHTDQDELPEALPEPQLTCGFIIESTDTYINIATNVNYNKEASILEPVDGFVIPKDSIISVRKIRNYEEI